MRKSAVTQLRHMIPEKPFDEVCWICGLPIDAGQLFGTDEGPAHGACKKLAVDEQKRKEQWVRAGQQFGRALDAMRGAAARLQWHIGDWLIVGQDEGYISHDAYEAAASITGYKVSSLQKFAYVARRFPVCMRMQDLPWGVHQLIAPFESADERKAMLTYVDENYDVASIRKVRKKLKELKQAQKIDALKPVATEDLAENSARVKLWALFDAAEACGEAFELDSGAMLAAFELEGRKKAAVVLRAAAAKLIACAELAEADDPIEKAQGRAHGKKRQRNAIVRVN